MVAPPFLGRIFTPKKYVFCCSIDTHWILERVMIFQGWPIPGKLTVVNHHGWTGLLHIFKPKVNPSIFFHFQPLIGSPTISTSINSGLY